MEEAQPKLMASNSDDEMDVSEGESEEDWPKVKTGEPDISEDESQLGAMASQDDGADISTIHTKEAQPEAKASQNDEPEVSEDQAQQPVVSEGESEPAEALGEDGPDSCKEEAKPKDGTLLRWCTKGPRFPVTLNLRQPPPRETAQVPLTRYLVSKEGQSTATSKEGNLDTKFLACTRIHVQWSMVWDIAHHISGELQPQGGASSGSSDSASASSSASSPSTVTSLSSSSNQSSTTASSRKELFFLIMFSCLRAKHI